MVNHLSHSPAFHDDKLLGHFRTVPSLPGLFHGGRMGAMSDFLVSFDGKTHYAVSGTLLAAIAIGVLLGIAGLIRAFWPRPPSS